MNHYLYKITDLITGFIYVGVRSCRCNPYDDNYYGSGIIISEEVREYGKRFFNKEIIAIVESRQQALNLEKEIVNKDFVSRYDTYNITTGGQTSKFARKKGIDSHWFGKNHSNESLNKMSKAKMGRTGKLCPNFRGLYYCGEYGVFESAGIASNELGVTVCTISNRCKSNKAEWVDWFFVKDGNVIPTKEERINRCDYYYIINGKFYHSMMSASLDIGIPERTIATYVKDKKPGFKKVVNEQK